MLTKNPFKQLILINLVGFFTTIIVLIICNLYGSEDLNLSLIDLFIIESYGNTNSIINTIVTKFRLPRSIFSFIVGSGLAMVGLIFQSLLRNPLADPYILGISSGAALGSLTAKIIAGTFLTAFSFSSYIGAFIGSGLAITIVWLIASQNRRLQVQTLILAGVMVGTFCAALSYLIISLLTSQAISTHIIWLMGNISVLPFNLLVVYGILIVLFLVIFFYLSSPINLLLLGDSAASTSGLNVERLKKSLLLLASILTAFLVAETGPIGFVGLIIPHANRIILGSDQRLIIFASFWTGGIFLTLSDLLSRIVIAPNELPIGVITALIGAPYFLFLLKAKKYG